MRAAIKEDLGATMSELVDGETIRLPGEFFEACILQRPNAEFVKGLRVHFEKMRSTRPVHHTSTSYQTFIPKELSTSPHVFVRHDAVTTSLQKPFDGPYNVIKRNDKHFTILIKGKNVTVGIDRLKPASGVSIETTNNCFITRSSSDPVVSQVQKQTRLKKKIQQIQTTTRTTETTGMY